MRPQPLRGHLCSKTFSFLNVWKRSVSEIASGLKCTTELVVIVTLVAANSELYPVDR
jgi:hypothetical protein